MQRRMEQEKKHNRGIIIEGPKGCGKTTLCCTLYQMSDDECIFLTSHSFNFCDVIIRDYFNNFFKKYQEHLDSLKTLTGELTDFYNASEMLTKVSKKVHLRVFVDLSLFTAEEKESVNRLLGLVESLNYSQLIVSASSGIQHVSGDKNILLKNKLQNIIKTVFNLVLQKRRQKSILHLLLKKLIQMTKKLKPFLLKTCTHSLDTIPIC